MHYISSLLRPWNIALTKIMYGVTSVTNMPNNIHLHYSLCVYSAAFSC